MAAVPGGAVEPVETRKCAHGRRRGMDRGQARLLSKNFNENVIQLGDWLGAGVSTTQRCLKTKLNCKI